MEKVKFEVGLKYYNSEKECYEICTKRTYQSVFFGTDRYNIKGKHSTADAEYTNYHNASEFQV